MNYKSVLFFLGIYSLLVSFFSILNILYSIYFDFILDLNSYSITFIISLAIGSLFCYIGRHFSKNIIIPNSDFKFEKKDLVVFLTKRDHLDKVESLFRISS